MSFAAQHHVMVVAIGGNAISPAAGDTGFAAERAIVERSMAEVARLTAGGTRLLLVHGNGTQVGRLLSAPGGDAAHLDIHVAQTQGEIGYLLAEALDRQLDRAQCVAVLTRVLVDPGDEAFRHPTKPVGQILPLRPREGESVRDPQGRGWRRVVASPRPCAVIEQDAIAELLRHHHVVAGGGGGIALSERGRPHQPLPAVVDKDWVAAALAIALDADRLLFVTDVPHAFEHFGTGEQTPLATLTVSAARQLLAAGTFAAGSMAPKVESGVQFASATGRPAVIAQLGAVAAALRGGSGTTIVPDP
jgi:carbamate kinase